MSATPTTDQDYARDPAADLAIQQAATKGTWINLCEQLGHVVAVDGDEDSYVHHICREPEGDERNEDMEAIAAAHNHAPAWLRRLIAAEEAIVEYAESQAAADADESYKALGRFNAAVERLVALAARIRAGQERGGAQA